MREGPSKSVDAVAWVDGETDPIRRRSGCQEDGAGPLGFHRVGAGGSARL